MVCRKHTIEPRQARGGCEEMGTGGGGGVWVMLALWVIGCPGIMGFLEGLDCLPLWEKLVR
jgi:hypothetical protein